MSVLAGKYLKYKQTARDPSWEKGTIYKVYDNGEVDFGPSFHCRCSATTLIQYLSEFEEVTEEEYNIQKRIIYEPLIFN